MKKYLSLILCLLTVLSFSATAYAAPEKFILDRAGMLYDPDSLNAQAADILSETGLVVSCCICNARDDMNEYEQAQSIFEEKYGEAKGILLLDLLDRETIYLFVSPSLSGVSDSDYELLLREYDTQSDYDSAVRAYLDTAETVTRRLAGIASPAENAPRRVVDQASVLSAQILEGLNTLADSISEQYQCDVNVLFVRSTGQKSAQAYADDYYDRSGCGYGPEHDGILLLVAVQDRSFAVTTTGYAIYAFTDYGQRYMDDQYLAYFSSDNWAEGARVFIETCGSLLYSARNGQPMDVPGRTASSVKDRMLKLIPIDIIVAFLLSFIPISSMKKKSKNVEAKEDAFDYVRPDSFDLTFKNDRFMHSAVSKIRKPEPQQSPSSGGGSSVHVSSSGRTHGGHSGRF